MAYGTSQALEMAVKSAAQASPMDTGRAISGFYFHRLLCRVFSEPDCGFVLKGGQSVLARTIDARFTRDIDLLSNAKSLDAALEELKRLVALDLNDFVGYEFVGATKIKLEDDYRSGVKARFNVLMGRNRKQDISIDLVVDEVPQDGFDIVKPIDRLEIKDLPVFDYRVYPVSSALADKFFGIIEKHQGRVSSRIKDLVDIVLYATTEEIDGGALTKRVHLEASLRGIVLPEGFSVPPEWHRFYESAYRKLVRQTGLGTNCQSLDSGEALASKLYDPVLKGGAQDLRWDHEVLAWCEAK